MEGWLTSSQLSRKSTLLYFQDITCEVFHNSASLLRPESLLKKSAPLSKESIAQSKMPATLPRQQAIVDTYSDNTINLVFQFKVFTRSGHSFAYEVFNQDILSCILHITQNNIHLAIFLTTLQVGHQTRFSATPEDLWLYK